MDIVVGDYRARNDKSYLARLEELAALCEDGGLFHGGHIHYIQGALMDQEGFDEGFTLKAAISAILERVPVPFPLDWPEQFDTAEAQGKELAITEAQQQAYREVNANLLMPVDGCSILQVIRKAREYEQLANELLAGKGDQRASP